LHVDMQRQKEGGRLATQCIFILKYLWLCGNNYNICVRVDAIVYIYNTICIVSHCYSWRQ